ncbi:MAG TPA: penicillin acylase family protein, partial [Vicinamibacteria bacterium]|nr:penicillin acylase family protein [Vicinamibacteria bacterium]
MRRRWPRVLAGLLLALVLAAGAGFGIASARLHDSLPLVRGELVLPGLGEPVRVERDSLGVPVVRGKSRADVARAIGFVHAQERFFQMDLLRRRAAGELAALVGKPALPADREVRPLQLRSVARRAVDSLPPDEREQLAAYTDGVNAGLHALRQAPFEYLLLRADPRPWLGEDSLLCALTMYLTLQGELAEQEKTLGLMHDLLPPALFEFLTPRGTEWDAPMQGVAFAQPALPGKEVIDLRRLPPLVARPSASAAPVAADELPSLGSNNWA